MQQFPTYYLEHIGGTHGLYEIRVKLGSDIFRIFCFFDEGKIAATTCGKDRDKQRLHFKN